MKGDELCSLKYNKSQVAVTIFKSVVLFTVYTNLLTFHLIISNFSLSSVFKCHA